jgi:pyoverdine/dityrosine biosynthesis protein Dit1
MVPSPYYEIRMQYKRDHAGYIVESSGCHVASFHALKAIFETVFQNYDSVNRLRQVVLPGTCDLFISFECPLQKLKSETDFDTVRICELCPAAAQHVSGILSLNTKRCYSNEEASPKTRMSQLSCLPQRQALLIDQARYRHISCDDQIRKWLSTVCLPSDQLRQDITVHDAARGASTDSSCIFEDSNGWTNDLQMSPAENMSQLDFSEYYTLIVLSQSGRQPPLQPSEETQAQTCFPHDAHYIADQVTSLFDSRLRSVAPDEDKWEMEGREFFLGKIEFFVLRGIPIECCLPAFPCKSSNRDKVASRSPDGAEFEALANLFWFCHEVEQLYKPGCRITVVSDGHVFSDCIGVDDHRVSEYTRNLHQMCKSILSQFRSTSGLVSPITFKNLHNLFLDDRALLPLFQDSYISTCELKHFIDTQMNPEDEKCRKLLMLSAQSDADNIVSCIKSKSENSLTSLFRGFSKFMLEDLACHPSTDHLSKSQRKKLSEKIAFEMIKRNQAYSHLVEQIFPHFLRFSIHAHRNSGPKFGINLLPADRFRHLTSFSELDKSDILGAGDEQSERMHLHIPTPWHNSLLEIKGRRHSFVCKAAVVRTELSSPESKWEGGYFPSPRGERWMVAPKSKKQQWREKRDLKHIQLLEQMARKREPVHKKERNKRGEQINREHEESLEYMNDKLWTEVCNEFDLEVARGAETSDSSMDADDEDNDVLPEWMEASSESDSLDFVLWKHVKGESEAADWVQVPWHDLQVGHAMKRQSTRDNIYTPTPVSPANQPMAVDVQESLPNEGSHWPEVPNTITSTYDADSSG